MKTLLFLGDSITDCYHTYDTDGLGEGYVRMIAEKAGYGFGKVKVINKGFDGFTISALQRLWKRDGMSLQPDFITILIGINDIAVMKNTNADSAFALKEFQMNYRTLIQKIKESYDVPILLMEPFIFPHPQEYISWEPEVEAMSLTIKNLAKEYNCAFLSLYKELRLAAQNLSYDEITTDGIHLTRKGHEIISSLWFKKIETII